MLRRPVASRDPLAALVIAFTVAVAVAAPFGCSSGTEPTGPSVPEAAPAATAGEPAGPTSAPSGAGAAADDGLCAPGGAGAEA